MHAPNERLDLAELARTVHSEALFLDTYATHQEQRHG